MGPRCGRLRGWPLCPQPGLCARGQAPPGAHTPVRSSLWNVLWEAEVTLTRLCWPALLVSECLTVTQQHSQWPVTESGPLSLLCCLVLRTRLPCVLGQSPAHMSLQGRWDQDQEEGVACSQAAFLPAGEAEGPQESPRALGLHCLQWKIPPLPSRAGEAVNEKSLSVLFREPVWNWGKNSVSVFHEL